MASSPQAVRQPGESGGLQGIALVLMLIFLEPRRAAFMNDERSEEVINIVGHYVCDLNAFKGSCSFVILPETT